MPVNLKDLKNRIKSVKNTQQVTKAMKLVSAAKFGRAQQSVLQSRPYATALKNLVFSALSETGAQDFTHALLGDSEVNSDRKVSKLFVVLSSERGLCGGFNSSIFKHVNQILLANKNEGNSTTVLCVGKKAYQLLTRQKESLGLYGQSQTARIEDIRKNPEKVVDVNGITLVSTSFEKPTLDLTNQLASALAEQFAAKRFDQIVFVYNKFQSVVTQIPTDQILLPLKGVVKAVSGSAASGEGSVQNSRYEPNLTSFVDAVLPRFFAVSVLQIFLESNASEHGARMSAMDAATRNAKEMEKKLQTTYQRARQAAITTELIEIISGAEAL